MIKVPAHLEALIEAGGTLVTPTRRRAHALRLAHAAAQLDRGRRVWPSPDVLPLEGWLGRECERRALEGSAEGIPPRLLRPAEEWLLWRECTDEAIETLVLANPGALAEGLLAARRLAETLGIDLSGLRALAQSETALLLEVERAVGARVAALGAQTLEDALGVHAALGDARPVALCGFLLEAPRLRALRQARDERGWETLWCAPGAPVAVPEVLRAADPTEELDRIAGWCAAQLRAAPDSRLLVVLPGSLERCGRLAALIRQALDPGFTVGAEHEFAAVEGGAPLAQQPALAHALSALALLDGRRVPLEALLEWLRGSCWQESAEGRARLDLWLRERAPPALDRRTFETLLGATPVGVGAAIRERLAEAAAALGSAAGSPREWSERFQAALEALGWPGGTAGLDSPAQQTLLRLRELLEEYGQLSAVVLRLERSAAIERLSELAARTAYRPAEEDAAVTITASLADPIVRYDGIWVGGLDHDTLPQAPDPNPFLPLGAQLAAAWPAASAGGRLREAQALLGAWRAAAERLVLSAPLRDGDVTVLPSPLLEGWAPLQAPQGVPLPWLAERVHRDGQLETWVEAVRPWDARVPLPAGTRSLELQNLCPFRAYGELRLGCTPLESSEPGVPADLRGQLLHAALQDLWRELGDSAALAALGPEALDERLGACVEGALERLLAGQSAPPSAAALRRERQRAVRLMRALCELERHREAFTVRDTERAVELTLAGARVNLRIDRVDVLGDGSLAILDYKTGRPIRPDWYGERPSHPQLLAYRAALGEAVRALATVHLTAREIVFQGVAASAQALPGVQGVESDGSPQAPWAARVAAWQAVLERLATGFVHGEAAVDPKPGACEFCHLGALCRIGEGLEVPETDEALAEEGP
ncbi:MAG: PD-(D/E)XK nuclease family protein [Steroidobacteraceae bacterium]